MKTSAVVRYAACFTALLLTGPVHAQLEGTLFTRQEERNFLDQRRQQFLSENAEDGFDIEIVEIPELPEGEAVVTETGPVEFSFGGMMTRRDGGRSVWLNGRLLSEQQLPEGITIVTSERTASLRIAQEGNIYILRPGQKVDLISGTIIENFQQRQPAREVSEAAVRPPETSAEPTASSEDAGPSDGVAAADSGTAPETESTIGPTADGDRITSIANAMDQLSDTEAEALADELERRDGERGGPEASDDP